MGVLRFLDFSDLEFVMEGNALLEKVKKGDVDNFSQLEKWPLGKWLCVRVQKNGEYLLTADSQQFRETEEKKNEEGRNFEEAEK